MNDLSALAAALRPVVAEAGAAIMRVYDADIAVQRKADDSPLTLADLESQRILLDGLSRLTPGVPVVSEEASHADWSERSRWRESWLVDPLDGTREFVKRNGEFTVNVALIVEHEPVLGVVAAPALGLTYWGAAGLGAFRARRGVAESRIHVSPRHTPIRIVGSRSHSTPQTDAYLGRFPAYELTAIGSSLKFCLVAEGAADLYPRFGPTNEWDTAAGQAVLEAAGGYVTRPDGHRLRYNCRATLLNGDFLAFSDPAVLPPG